MKRVFFKARKLVTLPFFDHHEDHVVNGTEQLWGGTDVGVEAYRNSSPAEYRPDLMARPQNREHCTGKGIKMSR